VGKGTSAYLKEVEDQIVSYKLEQKVRCVGACYDMPAAYLLADVVVQVAEHPEAFGRVVAEAQAMGVPVIAPACGGPQEILIDQVTGWLYNPSRLQEFLNSLQQALELSFLDKKKLASIARERVLKYFDSRTMLEKTLQVYLEVLQERSS
jgi:glycosyltransferase involved in cell wall biosynthesis